MSNDVREAQGGEGHFLWECAAWNGLATLKHGASKAQPKTGNMMRSMHAAPCTYGFTCMLHRVIHTALHACCTVSYTRPYMHVALCYTHGLTCMLHCVIHTALHACCTVLYVRLFVMHSCALVFVLCLVRRAIYKAFSRGRNLCSLPFDPLVPPMDL
jgi:hypothetical protein